MATETIKQQEIPAGTWAVDPVHSSIGFAVTHNGVTTFRSGFERYDARLTGGEQPRLEGTVEVESIAIDEEMLKGHLLSPEFFDTQRFPQLRFTSTELSVGEDGTLRVLGELEIRGEKREVEASGRFAHLGGDLAGKERVGLSVEATVDRRNFGLDWQAQLPSGGDVLDYAVTIAVELELTAEEV
ncbi:MAG TPA: YceI family protein [Solirubrobacterales bacterium]|nr:YceI family protein [Solirubrobacterales bacterium]